MADPFWEAVPGVGRATIPLKRQGYQVCTMVVCVEDTNVFLLSMVLSHTHSSYTGHPAPRVPF